MTLRNAMLRPLTAVWGCLVLGLAATAVVTGCWDEGVAVDPGVTPPPAAAPPAKPLLKDWPKPAFALILTGEQHGYLEPCGCSATQSGGVSRRADLVKKMEAKGWSVIGLDLGGTLKRSRRQDQIKFEAILESLHDLHYPLIGLGREELRMGPENLISLHQPEDKIAFVSANVIFFGSPEIGTPLPYRIVEAGGRKIGVTSILGKTFRDDLLPDANVPDDAPLRVQDAAEALPAVITALKAAKPDLLVLLSHATVAESEMLCEKFPEFDIVLTAGGPEEPDDTPRQIGKSQLIMTGHKGKKVGVLGFYPDDKEHRLRYELVDLDSTRFKHVPEMDRHMKFYQERLKDENIAATMATIEHPNGAEFVGAKKCGECHTKAFAKWSNSKHSHAFESLSRGRKGEEEGWISRVHDAECLACHVTGWDAQEVYPYTSGFKSVADTPHLVGQQCENCHAAGSQHVTEEETQKKARGPLSEELQKWRRAMHLDTKMAKERVCNTCHDPDNSPHFEFEKYWKEVRHPGRD